MVININEKEVIRLYVEKELNKEMLKISGEINGI